MPHLSYCSQLQLLFSSGEAIVARLLGLTLFFPETSARDGIKEPLTGGAILWSTPLDGTSGDHRWHERWGPHLKIESGDPQEGFELARTLSEHIDRTRRTREAWENVMVTIRDLPPPR
jgi:hypothetical protein